MPTATLPTLIKRHLQTLLVEALVDTPAVLVNGPRQSGKTTLVRQSAGSMQYFSLDNVGLLAAVRADPHGFVRQIDRAIIDEVQRAPELLLALKMAIDQDRRPGRFLLTGSANIMSLPTIADSLAGRIEIHTLLPLSNAEISDRLPLFLEHARTQGWPARSVGETTCTGNALVERVLAGGYPEMRQRPMARRRQAWAQSYVATLLARDIKDVARIDETERIPQLLSVLALLGGQLLNLREIGGQLGLNLKTVDRYISVLEKLFLVRRLPAWSRNELNRLIKSTKIYFLDAGLQSALLRASSELISRDRSRFGSILETWVFGELQKVLTLAPEPWYLSHYRDKDQIEVDFVLESSSRQIIGIEVKAAATVNVGDFKGLRRLREHCRADFSSGIVLYDGDTALSFGEGLWAVPVGWI